MGLTINRATIGKLTGVAILTLAPAGCENFDLSKLNLTGKKTDTATASATDTSIKLVERDVEAPQVFQVTDKALWDGRPSLGGVWVAYPGEVQPERVIIRNQENNKFVIGALFKRERENPGPSIQLSSDAASALGILAGKPTALNVTALRRESVPETAKVADVEPIEEKKLAAIASTAIDVAAETAETTEAAVSTLEKPYIQIGIFSVETNARNTATSLKTQGVMPIVKAQESRGKKFWRVMVGPAATKTERSGLLKTARGLGFDDAYFVTN